MKIKTKINMHKLPAAAPACHYPVRGATARWPRSAVFSCLELYEFSFDSFDSFIVLCTAIKIKPKSYKSTDAVSRISWPYHDHGGWSPADPSGMVWSWGVQFTDDDSKSYSSKEDWQPSTSLSSGDKEIKVASLYCWAAQPHFPPIRST